MTETSSNQLQRSLNIERLAIILAICVVGCSNGATPPTDPEPKNRNTSITQSESEGNDRNGALREPKQNETLDVRCHLLLLDSDYFEKMSYSVLQENDGMLVLTDIETFFLFQNKHETKPAWNQIAIETETSVHDDVAEDGDDYPVNILWRRNDDPANNELAISAPGSSEFKLSSTKTAVVPNGGSVILRTVNPTTPGKATFLWIIARTTVRANSRQH